MVAVLQPGEGPIDGAHYLPASPDTISWGWLPHAASTPVLAVRSGDVVTVDTVSHEGIMDDQGRDPVAFFARHGVARADVLDDAVAIASEVPRTQGVAGPHVVTGPIAVAGARPGDLLAVELVGIRRRVPYGVISNRHGLGALAGELPAGPPPDPDATAATWEGFRTVSAFAPVEGDDDGDGALGVLGVGGGRTARFPLAPFLGLQGVAVAADAPVHSTAPGPFGGNLDVNRLQVGTTLYLPVQVDGAGFHAGDPHFAQGAGEVCLTALEGSLRADVRLTVHAGADARSLAATLGRPWVETDDHWISVGLGADLDTAARAAVRGALDLLAHHVGADPQLAYLYCSAAADLEVSQVVNRVVGVHCRIRKADFASPDPNV